MTVLRTIPPGCIINVVPTPGIVRIKIVKLALEALNTLHIPRQNKKLSAHRCRFRAI